MKITILDDTLDAIRHLDCFAKLQGHDVKIWNDHTKDLDVLADRLKKTEALVLIRERTPVRAPLIERLPRLKLISQRSVYPHIDVDACTKHGVLLCSDMHPGRPSFATAELTWGLVLAAMRGIPQQMAALKTGRWQTMLGTAVRGRTLGILGYGRIGASVAGYGRAFGMKVLAWGREGSVARARAEGFEAVATKEALFEQSDVLSVHLRATKSTQSLVTAADLARMKSTALFVNTSRAAVVEPGALLAALSAGRPGMAAVDVYEEEPIVDGNHPLLKMDNVVCTPHIGYVERDGYESAFGMIFDQVLAYAEGKPVNMINPEVLGKS
ncbi:MAG: 3-phosphoglycerate dehydrogenase [Betaproteobacteria bacterium SG8_41]|jgi:D-3-phosphoglycerate dehydrogenase|nr:MAG: 3-phosphoglycerate dehydrogenase [Betaproteobacteria bacterium SG8_41]